MLTKIKSSFEFAKKSFSKRPKAAPIFATLLVLSIMVAVVFVHVRKTVTIVIDGKSQEVVTYEKTVNELLKKASIELKPEDKISIGVEENLEEGQEINIKKAFEIAINIDGKTVNLKTTKMSINKLLQSKTLKDTFKDNGVELVREHDKLSKSGESTIKIGDSIDVTRVDTKVETKVLNLGYQVVNQKDNSKPLGYKMVIQKGQQGQKEVQEEVVLENGVEVSRTVIGEAVIAEPINEVVSEGAQAVMVASRGGEPTGYSRKLTMRSSAYSTGDAGVGSTTATGRRVLRDPSGYSTVAVDPRVIPLGTKLYIPGYGLAIAADTGGAIKNNKIDLFFNSRNDCMNWGVRHVDVYILS